MDRTNWQCGKKKINILFLCIVYRGISIPIYWLVLNKNGNSSTRERIALMDRFVRVFGLEVIAGLLADREFIGERWFGWLIRNRIPFYIRIRNDANTYNKHGKVIDISWLFHRLKAGEKLKLKQRQSIFGHSLFVSGGKAPNGELMIIASNVDHENAVEIYLLRWQIEVMFQCFKSRGFGFEDTHITDRAKIKKVIVLLAIGFCWAHVVGEWAHSHERVIKLKKHGRKEISYFRYGLNLIHAAIIKLFSNLVRPIKRLMNLLRPPNINILASRKRIVFTGRIF